MISLELQDELILRMKKEFEHLKLKNLENDKAPINIFSQHLPAKSKKEDIDPYPCIIVRLTNGSSMDVDDPNSTTIQFIIGVVDRDSSNQGYRDALTVANRICKNLQKNPMVDKRYELQLPINWAYNDEDAEPYYFAGIETRWSNPGYLREDVEELI